METKRMQAWMVAYHPLCDCGASDCPGYLRGKLTMMIVRAETQFEAAGKYSKDHIVLVLPARDVANCLDAVAESGNSCGQTYTNLSNYLISE